MTSIRSPVSKTAVLEYALRAAGAPPWEREHRFHPVRRWRFDLAWPDAKFAVEVDGGLWESGRHNRAAGYIADCEKMEAAMLAGWTVYRVPTDWIAGRGRSKYTRPVDAAVETIMKMLKP